jgi:uncharacterized protein
MWPRVATKPTRKEQRMLERDGYPAGVPCWVDTDQPDPRAAVEFYRGLFGWEFEDRMPADTPGSYFVATLRGSDVAAVGTKPEDAAWPNAWNTYIWVESANEAAKKVESAGGAVVMKPFDVGDAGRMAVVTDPEGAAFNLWEAGQHRGAQLVNEPGTWNFSELNTRDPERAKAFYGAVFGWEANRLDGGGETSMWRVPGYGDFLERRDPDVRQRQAEISAPEGFEDAVAWLVPITSDQLPETPPHWSVTFAVDDADAIAERTEELGGKVLAPPVDAPWVRTTVVSDPQGAVFTASKFLPPTGGGSG